MLAVFSNRLNVTSALFGFVPDRFWLEQPELSEVAEIRHNYPPEVLGPYNDDDILSNDPCVICVAHGAPWFLWEDVALLPNLTAAQRARMDTGAPEANVGVTICMPFFEGRAVAGLGLCAMGTPAEEFRRLWQADVEGHLAIAHAFDAHMRPRMIANRYKLSKREASVVRLLATGLSAKRVADQLGLQTKTVFNVMDKSRKTLAAETTLQAVNKALAYRLI